MNALWIALHPDNSLIAYIAKESAHAFTTGHYAWSGNCCTALVIMIDMHSLSPIKLKRFLTRSASVGLCHSHCSVLFESEAVSSQLHTQLLHIPVLSR